MKSASIFALGMALSVSANAADLGGNCCADLEERVAELEATVAKKGTRKMSLTVYGWVNKTMMHWDDGVQSNNYLGIDNTNSATRFGFRGDAAINSEWKAGYNILLDVFTGATSARANQRSEDGDAAFLTGVNTTANQVTFSTGDDHLIRMRDANFWLESSRLGRVTMGRLTQTGPTGVIDLGGISNIASASMSLLGGGMQFRNAANNQLTAFTISNQTDAAGDFNYRVDGLKWDSPTWHGFVLGASIGEARETDRSLLAGAANTTSQSGRLGTAYAVNLRYAGEFNGVRVASSIGYEVSKNEETGTSVNTPALVIGAGNAPTPAAAADFRNNTVNFGLAGSLLHTATGLFLQGHYITLERGNNGFAGSDKAKHTLIQGGLTRNFFGIGATALYGEWGRVDGGNETFNQSFAVGLDATALPSDLKIWGIGMTQNIDAAAMQLYAGYRNYSLEHTGGLQFKDIGVLAVGGRINF